MKTKRARRRADQHARARTHPKRTPLARGRKPGRPRWTATKQELRQITQLVRNWATNEEIMESLGIGKDLFYAELKRNPQFIDAIQRGRADAVAEARETVGEIMRERKHKDRLRAAAFVLQSRGNWRQKHEITGSEGGPVETKDVTPQRVVTPLNLRKIAELLAAARKE